MFLSFLLPLSLVTFLGSTLAFLLVLYLSDSLFMIFEFNLFLLSGANISIPLVVDNYSLIFGFSVCLISFSVMIFSQSYMAEEKHFSRFHWLVFLFVMSMLMLIYSPNMVSVILGWDGLGVTSFLLVAYFNSSKSFNAAMITALSNRVGDCLILVSMAIMVSRSSLNFFIISSTPANSFSMFLVVLITIAACTKSAQIPFSAWLPAAMAAPTPVSSLVHSSTLVTAGVYLMIRFNYLLLWPMNKYLFLIGCFTMTMASFSAFFESDMKKIIALSTLSQLGLMMTAVGLNYSNLAFFHLLTHAYFKAMMFMAVGSLIHLNSSLQDFRLTSVNHAILGPSMSFIIVANLSLMGIPYMGGFYSKDLILDHCLILSLPSWELAIMLLSVGLTAIYSFRFLVLTLWSSLKFSSLSWASDNDLTVNQSMSNLWPLAIAGGSFLCWTLFPSPVVGILPPSCKLLVMSMIIAGVFLSLFTYKSIFLSMKNFYSWGFGNLWSLPTISSFPVNLSTQPGLFMHQRLDNSWGFFLYLSRFLFNSLSFVKDKNLFLLETLPAIMLLIFIIFMIY